ncbi:HesA/MoeB/ThiF family protein [Bifidobacterium miconisargentati]|uniref:HesA/MoeB/ThiF family protein n=1 Tax=Bifidobacterium miconisargentati TaxID=2834437 RepID=UPI001BDDC9E4|nr:ThiF family adenylyltransferase [Bifidobacterium miconisargentati]MBW3091303.1 ThiF family adenylyltransferase [Bifidobacterium miconisargentati]
MKKIEGEKMKIKIRSGHEVLPLDSKTSIIGSMTSGLAHQFPDPDNEIAAVINQVLNGEYDLDDAVERLANLTHYTRTQSLNIIREIERMGHLETVEEPTTLSDEEKQRYSRSSRYLSWINQGEICGNWHLQELLKQKRVAVLGLGGIGSGVAYHLAASGVGHIRIVDYDTVELSNLSRQMLFDEEDIGALKVDVVKNKLLHLNHNVEVDGVQQHIRGNNDIMKLIDGMDFFFCCADSPEEITEWANNAALYTNIPWISCSYNGPIVQCGIYVPGKTGCFRCLIESVTKKLELKHRSSAYMHFQRDVNPVFGPIAQISAALSAYEGIRYLLDLSPQSVGRIIHVNMYNYFDSYVIDVPQDCHYAHIAKARG